MAELRLRQGVRGIILDPADRVLSVYFDFKIAKFPFGLWACPGGGIEPGESHLEALQREMLEEVGLVVNELGPMVWTRTAIFPMNGWDGQTDYYYLHRTPAFVPNPALSKEELEAEDVFGLRWWSLDELREGQAAFDQHGEPGPGYPAFAPRDLAHLLDDLLVSGVPETAIDVY